MSKETAVKLPPVVSAAEWQKERDRLLVREKALTRALGELAAERRRLPMVRIDKDYTFDGPGGKAGLRDLFEGRRQLLLYHFMYGPNQDAGCDGCSMFVDQIGHPAHLHARDTSFALVSRAPLAKVTVYKKRMGWTIPGTRRSRATSTSTSVSLPRPRNQTSTRTARRSGSASSFATATASFVPTSRRTAASRRSAARGPSST